MTTRRTSSYVKFIKQATYKIVGDVDDDVVNEDEVGGKFLKERCTNHAESLLECSSKYSLAFIASKNTVTAVDPRNLEPNFAGGDEEQELEEDAIVASVLFSGDVKFMALSSSENFLAVVFSDCVELHHISIFRPEMVSWITIIPAFSFLTELCLVISALNVKTIYRMGNRRLFQCKQRA